MRNHLCCWKPQAAAFSTPPPAIHLNCNLQYSTELNSYEAACKVDKGLQSFDTNLQSRTNQVINTLAVGVEVHALSFDSLKEVIECLLEMNQDVVKVILDCKEDIWKTQELFELVEEYFENSLQTVKLCAALEICLNRARDSQLLILLALQTFEEESTGNADGSTTKYVKTLEELKNFRNLGDPFTEEFIQVFQSVKDNQMAMLDKLNLRMKKLDKKLKCIHALRTVSSIIFVATFAAVLICSVVAAAMAAPPVAAALAAATSIPLGSMGKWIDSLWKNYETALKGQEKVVSIMHKGTYIANKYLENIKLLIDRLEIEIQSLLHKADFVIEEEAVKVGIEEIRKQMEMFMKNVEEFGSQAYNTGRVIRKARTEVLQRIINTSPFLTAGELKMNTDGCFYETNNHAGIGGVVRDVNGGWILGFYGRITCTNSLEAEIWAIYRGLIILVEKGLSNVQIEADSSKAVTFCQEESTPDHPLRYIIEEARRLITKTQSKICHINRQANQAADCFARLGSLQDKDVVVTTTIPLAAREYVLADSMGIGHTTT